MKKSKSFVDSLSSVAIYFTLGCLVLVIFSLLFPALLTDASRGVINSDSYTDPSVGVRRTILNAQIIVLYISSAIFVLIFGGLMTGFHYSDSRRIAGATAVGANVAGKKYLMVWGLVGVNFILLGSLLPRIIFNPTNEQAFSQYYPFFSSARDGWLMGSIFGLILLIFVILLTLFSFNMAVKIPQAKRENNHKSRLQIH